MVFFSFSYKILKFQIIYLIRDPRAIYASMTKLKQAKSTWKDRLSKFGSVVCENMLNDFYLSHIIPPERYACTGVIYSIGAPVKRHLIYLAFSILALSNLLHSTLA